MMINKKQHGGGAGAGAGACSPRMLKFLTLLGMCLAGYIVGPSLYWHISESVNSDVTLTSCPSCHCDCLDQPLFSLPQGLNASFLTDCMRRDSEEGSEDSDKNFAEILSGELRQKEAEALANQQRADVALLEAKKMANQYQKDADKCNNGMETCEDARERAEDALDAQRELTSMWEMRARHVGWKPELSESTDDDNNVPLEGEANNLVQDTDNLVHDTEARAESFEESNKVPDADAQPLERVQNAEAGAESLEKVQNAEAKPLDGTNKGDGADAGAESLQKVQNVEADSLEKVQNADAESLETVQNAEADSLEKVQNAEAESFENNRVQEAEAESHTETIAAERR